MNIDWSKAPEDATHAGNSPYEKGVITWFKGISDPASRNYFMNEGSMNAWAISSENLSAWDLIERPKKQEAWNGEGLPPVGSVVDTDHKNKEIRVKILAYGAHHAGASCVLAADMSHGIEGKMFGWMSDQCNFRQIKTAEQLAEEEKKQAIDDMQRIYEESMLDYSSRLGHASRPAIKALYEAGYRKQ